MQEEKATRECVCVCGGCSGGPGYGAMGQVPLCPSNALDTVGRQDTILYMNKTTWDGCAGRRADHYAASFTAPMPGEKTPRGRGCAAALPQDTAFESRQGAVREVVLCFGGSAFMFP